MSLIAQPEGIISGRFCHFHERTGIFQWNVVVLVFLAQGIGQYRYSKTVIRISMGKQYSICLSGLL